MIFIFYNPANIFGQDHPESNNDNEETANEHHLNYKNSFKKHYISVLWGNTIVPAAKTSEGENSVSIFPSWGINYEYFLNNHFGLGLLNEFEMQSYAVEHDEDAIIERVYPVISSIVLIYEPINHLALFAGPGIEFEKSENLSIIKAGAAYTFPLPKYFGISLELSYERKNKTYDAWTLGILLGKGFGKTVGH